MFKKNSLKCTFLEYYSIMIHTKFHSMRNRAEKDAVRWCHLTLQFIAGASVHIREPKTRVAPIFCFVHIYKP